MKMTSSTVVFHKANSNGDLMSPRLILRVAPLLLGLAACSGGPKTSTGRTERETDSVIGQSAVPGATGVKKALDAQDTSRARATAIDSAAAQ